MAVAFLITNVMDFNNVLHGHVSPETDCVDRVLLDVAVPDLEVADGRLAARDRQEAAPACAEPARQCEDHWAGMRTLEAKAVLV